MLLQRSPEYWARDANIEELQDEVRQVDAWTEPVAEVLDFAYIERAMRAMAGAKDGARGDALALADHLERVAHDSVRRQLDALARRYFTRWRLLAEILHRRASKLEVPHKVLDRKHVRGILRQLHAAGGWVGQGELTQIANEGQRSATLKLMEQWELIERRADGTARLVAITDVGRLAIAPEVAAQQAAPVSTLKRGCEYMYRAP